MAIIFSTVGTSLLTNLARQLEEFKGINLYNYSNFKEEQFTSEKDIKEILDNLILKSKELLKSTENKWELKRLSAELNGIVSYYETDTLKNFDHHIFICTDTYQSKKVGEILSEFFNSNRIFKKSISAEYIVIPGLSTKSKEDFELGVLELLEKMAQKIDSFFGHEIVFNLVGGFKAIQGILTAMGMVWADKVLYIFETSNELLEIPRLPVGLDLKIIEENFQVLRKLSLNLPLGNTEKNVVKEKLNALASANFEYLSAWGKVLFEKVKRKVYASLLHDPPVSYVHFSENLIKNFKILEKEEKYMANVTIDDLILWKNGKKLSRSTVKPLKGDFKGVTHEIYLSNSKDAKRIFFEINKGEIFLKAIDKHLKC